MPTSTRREQIKRIGITILRCADDESCDPYNIVFFSLNALSAIEKLWVQPEAADSAVRVDVIIEPIVARLQAETGQ